MSRAEVAEGAEPAAAPIRRTRARTAVEAAATATGGGALGWLVSRPLGLGWFGAVVGAANGAVSGGRGIYDWRSTRGLVAFGLDSTWNLVGVTAALVVHAVNVAGRVPVADDLARRQGRHVYAGGFRIRRGFVVCVGNVVSAATGPGGLDPATPAGARRRRLVEVHEDLHVWQQRWFGPLFVVAYAAWSAGGVVVGSLAWLRHGRAHRIRDWIETAAYYDNPFEYWAYRADGSWPPHATVPALAWGPRRPRAPSFEIS